MYCYKCGVELSGGEKKCPLCGTKVCLPEGEVGGEKPDTFPDNAPAREEFNKNGLCFVVSVIFALPLLLTLICDLSINGTISWSGYVASSLAFGYVLCLPMWFNRPNPVIFVSVDFAALELLILYICLATKGDWFLPFAFPVIGAGAVIMVAVITLMRYIKRGYLYIIGGALIATGLYTFFIEALVNLTFKLRDSFIWFFYPLTALSLLGLALIVIAIVPTFRESLKRKFFI